MNLVEVTGSRKSKRELAFETCSWYIRNFLPRFKTLDISINLKTIDGAYGYCMEGETNREFEIEIDKNLSDFDLIATVIHEMIHVKQYARREMQQVGNKVLWKSKLYGNIAYYKQPWEKEAHKYDEKLAKQFIDERS